VVSPALDDLQAAADAAGISLDSDALQRIGRFLDLLEVWNRRIRLTGDRERGLLVRKHVSDSLAVVPELPASGMVVDLGSGGGFPGIVLACARPDLDLRLVEPRRRPTSFLSEVIRTIPLPMAKAVAMRGEDAAAAGGLGGRAAVVVSRALRLDVLLRLAAPLLAPGGRIVAMQTPSSAEQDARASAEPLGLGLFHVRDYVLPDGERRRLLLFARN
jgi:16S rRNA (guanine527-N7)-methyltransferase